MDDQIRITMNRALYDSLDEAAKILEVSPNRAVIMAIAFLLTAAKAKADGKSIGMVDDPAKLDVQIVGF